MDASSSITGSVLGMDQDLFPMMFTRDELIGNIGYLFQIQCVFSGSSSSSAIG
jgi:hypothetical protein